MLLHLLHSVEKAIQTYENTFGPDRSMSLRRAQDIIALRSLLKSARYENAERAIDCIQTQLEQIQTGWWIFKTGRSQLKHHIMRVLAYFRDDATVLLFDTVQDIATSLEHIPAFIHQSYRPENGGINALHMEMRALSDANRQLQRRITELERENQALLRASVDGKNQPAQSAQPAKALKKGRDEEDDDDNDDNNDNDDDDDDDNDAAEAAAEVGRAPHKSIN